MGRTPRNVATTETMNDLKLFLQALCDNDINVAKHMLQTTLNNEGQLQELVQSEDIVSTNIVSSIKEWTKDKLGKVRKEKKDASFTLIEA